jgi:hypothetical protein
MNTIPAEGTWTVKDLIGHLSSWENACLLPMRGFSEGEPFTPPDIPDDLVWNDEQAAIKAPLSISEVIQESRQTYEELLRLVEHLDIHHLQEIITMPWREEGTILKMIDGLAWHQEEHNKSLLKLK